MEVLFYTYVTMFLLLRYVGREHEHVRYGLTRIPKQDAESRKNGGFACAIWPDEWLVR